jgi:alkanesulfonate monooxygenase SsuD/methylene tetrahydromethanopterin reductase-like flavin-dependent oxidoreductase (luciferase family)
VAFGDRTPQHPSPDSGKTASVLHWADYLSAFLTTGLKKKGSAVNDEELALVDMDNLEAPAASPRGGTMVMRVWTEEGQQEGFRARLTFTAAEGEESTLVFAGDPEQVVEAVRKWLSRMAG